MLLLFVSFSDDGLDPPPVVPIHHLAHNDSFRVSQEDGVLIEQSVKLRQNRTDVG